MPVAAVPAAALFFFVVLLMDSTCWGEPAEPALAFAPVLGWAGLAAPFAPPDDRPFVPSAGVATGFGRAGEADLPGAARDAAIFFSAASGPRAGFPAGRAVFAAAFPTGAFFATAAFFATGAAFFAATFVTGFVGLAVVAAFVVFVAFGDFAAAFVAAAFFVTDVADLPGAAFFAAGFAVFVAGLAAFFAVFLIATSAWSFFPRDGKARCYTPPVTAAATAPRRASVRASRRYRRREHPRC